MKRIIIQLEICFVIRFTKLVRSGSKISCTNLEVQISRLRSKIGFIKWRGTNNTKKLSRLAFKGGWLLKYRFWLLSERTNLQTKYNWNNKTFFFSSNFADCSSKEQISRPNTIKLTILCYVFSSSYLKYLMQLFSKFVYKIICVSIVLFSLNKKKIYIKHNIF